MKTDLIMATNHSLRRAKERAGLNMASAQKVICNARERGLGPWDFTGFEREYLIGKQNQHEYAVAYQGKCFVFSDSGVCITVLELPGWFGRKKYYDRKERIRNLKKYSSHYPEYGLTSCCLDRCA